MNILVVCHHGLYQNFTFSFVHNQAKAYVAAGHRVRVIIPVPLGKTLQGSPVLPAMCVHQQDGVDLFYVRYLSASNFGKKGFNVKSAVFAISAQLRKILDGFAPDVIHAHTLGFDSGIGAWLKKKLGLPLVVTTHGSDTEIPLKQGKAQQLKAACDEADRIVAVSKCLGQRLQSCGTQTPIVTILNGFIPNTAERNRPKDPYAILQVGHLIPSKRNAVTIQALALLRKAYPKMTLKVIGTGALRQELEELVKALELTDAVTFTGEVPNPQVLSAMAEASYFVMPSKPEGFGIVYLEAMSNRCVTIGTEGEGISELIVSGENGFLVPSDDPEAVARVIGWCMEHPNEASVIAERGQKDTELLTWEQNAARYSELFRSLSGNL